MAQLSNCNLPWIDKAVNAFAALPTVPAGRIEDLNRAKFSQCCSAPGECKFFGPDEDPFIYCTTFGILSCALGNSKYTCEFTQFPPKPSSPSPSPSPSPQPSPSPPPVPTGSSLPAEPSPTLIPDDPLFPDPNLPPEEPPKICLQEGTLALTRSLPCCPPHFSKFLKNMPCLQGSGDYDDTLISCQPGDAPQCETMMFDAGNNTWSYDAPFFGNRTVIYGGYIRGTKPNNATVDENAPLELACIEEVELGGPVTNGTCLAVKSSTCNAGGSAAGTPPPSPGPVLDDKPNSAASATKI
ncbi:hypothetical protein FBU30_010000, partial [Linnemannia zychae]